jgi:hypothetical protein
LVMNLTIHLYPASRLSLRRTVPSLPYIFSCLDVVLSRGALLSFTFLFSLLVSERVKTRTTGNSSQCLETSICTGLEWGEILNTETFVEKAL